jgi:hypothetical protein
MALLSFTGLVLPADQVAVVPVSLLQLQRVGRKVNIDSLWHCSFALHSSYLQTKSQLFQSASSSCTVLAAHGIAQFVRHVLILLADHVAVVPVGQFQLHHVGRIVNIDSSWHCSDSLHSSYLQTKSQLFQSASSSCTVLAA